MKSEKIFVLVFHDDKICVQTENECLYNERICYLNSDQAEDILEFTNDVDYCIEVSTDVRKQV